MTLYRSLIEKTRQKTLKILVPRGPQTSEQKALQDRKRVFLRFRSVRDSGEQITQKMKH